MKRFPRFQVPAEFPRVNPHGNAGNMKIVNLGLRKEIAAVDKAYANGLARLLCCVAAFQRQKRVKLMAAVSPHAVNRLDSGVKRMLRNPAFPSPRAVEVEHDVIAARQVEGKAHSRVEKKALAFAGKAGAAGNDGHLRINGVNQRQLCLQHRVAQVNFKRFGFPVIFHISGRQALQFRFSGINPMCFVLKIRYKPAVRVLHRKRRRAHIPGAVRGILLPDLFEGKVGIPFKYAGRHVAPRELQQVGKALPVPNPFSKVKLTELAVF